MSPAEEGPQRVRSINSLRAVFEQRADLDAFWLASVDFSKEKTGLSTRLFGQSESLPQGAATSTESVTEEQPAPSTNASAHNDAAGTEERAHESWRELYHSGIPEDTCELPQMGLHVVGDLSGTIVSQVGRAGLLSQTLPGTAQTVYPSGRDGLEQTLPQDLAATGVSDLMMPHAIGMGIGMNTTSGFLQETASSDGSGMKENPLFELGQGLAAYMRPGTLSRAPKGTERAFTGQEVEKRFSAIAKSLTSSRSSFQAASACRRLTSVLQITPPETWEGPLTAQGIIPLLMPHPLAAEVSLAHAATQALAVLASTAPDATLLALAHAGAIGVVSKVATGMLDSTSLTPEDASQAIVLMLRAAVLPIMRSAAAAEAAAGAQQEDLQELAEVGRRLLEQCQPGGNRNMAHAQCLLLHLQCTHALLACAPPSAVVVAQRTGLLLVALQAYMLSHDTALASAYAWELRKALAVLDVVSAAFRRLEGDIMEGSDGPAFATSRRTMAVDAVVQAVQAAAPAGAALPLMQGLLADVRLRDRPSIAVLALQALHLLLVSCGVPVVELAPAHVVAVSTLADVWTHLGMAEAYCELLIHLWCESAAAGKEVKLRLRALVCRALGRQAALSTDALAFVRQHVVPHCIMWLDWETAPAFAYSLRSFAAQDRQVRKTLLSNGFMDAAAAAATRGEPIAADVLLDLAAIHDRTARHAARASVLSSTPLLLSAASSPARAECGIITIATSTVDATQEFCAGLPTWVSEAALAAAAGGEGLHDAARVLRLLVRCAEAGGPLGDAALAVPAAAQLAVDVVRATADAEEIAAGMAAVAHLEVPSTLLHRLMSKGGLVEAVRRIPAARGAELLKTMEAAAAVLERSGESSPSTGELMLAAGLQPACVALVKGLLAQWDKGALEAAYGGGWLEEQGQEPSAAEGPQAWQEARVTNGGRRRALMPGIAAAFVDQVGAVHATARLALTLTQQATAASNLVDPIAEFGPHLLSVLTLVEANCKDVRLSRLLEAAGLMLRTVPKHLELLLQTAPPDGKTSPTARTPGASIFQMWQGRLGQPARVQGPLVELPDKSSGSATSNRHGHAKSNTHTNPETSIQGACDDSQSTIAACSVMNA
eukprot:jgi/Ulvmu1/8113/UM040_0008.1